MSFRELKCLVYIQKRKANEHADKDKLYVFSEVISVSIDESYDEITNQMDVVLPNIKNFYGSRSKKTVNPVDLFNVGDLIRVKLSYARDTNNLPNTDEPYKGANRVAIFNGFITDIGIDKTNVILKCEDMSWWLKQKSILFPHSTIYKFDSSPDPAKLVYYIDDEKKFEDINNIKLSEYIRHCLWDYEFPFLQEDGKNIKYKTIISDVFNETDFTLGTLKFDSISIYETFEMIKKKYKIPFYFKYDRLYVGNFAQTKEDALDDIGFEPVFIQGINVIDSSSLTYHTKEDMHIKLRVNAFGNGNEAAKVKAHKYKKYENTKYPVLYIPTKETANAPLDKLSNLVIGYNIDESFSTRDIFVYNDFIYKDTNTGELTQMSAQRLYSLSKNILDHYAYDGYRGSFKTFGEFVVYAGEVVKLVSVLNESENKDGYYLIKSVKREFSVNSPKFRQEIELSYSINQTELYGNK